MVPKTKNERTRVLQMSSRRWVRLRLRSEAITFSFFLSFFLSFCFFGVCCFGARILFQAIISLLGSVARALRGKLLEIESHKFGHKRCGTSGRALMGAAQKRKQCPPRKRWRKWLSISTFSAFGETQRHNR